MIDRHRAPGAPAPAQPPILLPVTPIVSTDRPPRLPKP
jgi:hypothetical protein